LKESSEKNGDTCGGDLVWKMGSSLDCRFERLGLEGVPSLHFGMETAFANRACSRLPGNFAWLPVNQQRQLLAARMQNAASSLAISSAAGG
jgi:hypothetical protein